MPLLFFVEDSCSLAAWNNFKLLALLSGVCGLRCVCLRVCVISPECLTLRDALLLLSSCQQRPKMTFGINSRS